MTFKIELVTDAERSEVLRAIQADLREWRESLLPPAIRKRGVTHLVGSVNGGDFTIRVSPERRSYSTVSAHGTVQHRPGGGSVIRATVRTKFPLVLIVLTCGVAIVAAEVAAWIVPGIMLGAYLVSNAFLSRNDPEAAYLDLRLRGAVARASEPSVSADSPDT